MELGELVNVAIPEQKADKKCPFSHEKPNPKEKNELGGIGTKLGDNCADGVGVHTQAPPIGADYVKGSKNLDPRDRKNKVTCVTIEVDGEVVTTSKDEPVLYPLTCAAHHLVPAQESLKEHDILDFMCNSWDKQDFRKKGKEAPSVVSTAKVWGNVAYNVNGCQNGVWLPGNYAVGAGVGGVEIWKSRKGKRSTYSNKQAAKNWAERLDLTEEEWATLSRDPEEDDGPQPRSLASAIAEAVGPEYMLVGANYNVDDQNPKWCYVKAAMDEIGGQFHDRHGDYSNEVKTYLTKIHEAYADMYVRSTKKTKGKWACEDCQNATRPAKADDSQVGPPYNIVTRLVKASNFFKRYVMQTRKKKLTRTNLNIYTSKWVSTWVEENP